MKVFVFKISRVIMSKCPPVTKIIAVVAGSDVDAQHKIYINHKPDSIELLCKYDNLIL
jgi:hypothetical protein